MSLMVGWGLPPRVVIRLCLFVWKSSRGMGFCISCCVVSVVGAVGVVLVILEICKAEEERKPWSYLEMEKSSYFGTYLR